MAWAPLPTLALDTPRAMIMISGKCPVCKKTFSGKSLDELPAFPFCSERCRCVDLGRWLDGAYLIPGVTGTVPPTTKPNFDSPPHLNVPSGWEMDDDEGA